MSTLFIIDIDGCIAHAGRRFEEAGPEPDRSNKEVYEAWVRRVQNEDSLLADKPVPGMISLCQALSEYCLSGGNAMQYVTSREERWRDVTTRWLEKHHFPRRLALTMRGNGNYAEGVDFKETMIDMLVQVSGCEEVVVVDDDGRGDIEPMCARRGWTFLKARSGGQR